MRPDDQIGAGLHSKVAQIDLIICGDIPLAGIGFGGFLSPVEGDNNQRIEFLCFPDLVTDSFFKSIMRQERFRVFITEFGAPEAVSVAVDAVVGKHGYLDFILEVENPGLQRRGVDHAGIVQRRLCVSKAFFSVIPYMVVVERHGFHTVFCQHRNSFRIDTEQEFVILFALRDFRSVCERAFKIDDGQVITHEDVPDILHDEMDVSVMRIQFRCKEILAVIIIAADRQITGAGNGHDIGTVTVLLILRGLLLGELDQFADIHLVLGIKAGFLSECNGKEEKERAERRGEFTVHNFPP